MPSRKNKHGDRGSIEEETNVAEWPNTEPNGHAEERDNMAEHKESDAALKEEPALYEIRDMLADLQTLVTSILKENSTLREDMKQLKSSLQSKERKVSVLKNIIGKGVKS